MRYFIEIAYKGTGYAGWQMQKNKPTIQGTINEALSTVCNTAINITGAGRTDSGVHCLQTFAHFDVDTGLPEKMLYRANKLLPKDIAIRNLIHVAPDAHARFDAISRSYSYYIHATKNPMLADRSFFFPFLPLDLKAMEKATALLTSFKDYKPLSKYNKDLKTTLCDVFNAEWETNSAKQTLVFCITANRFLHGMVRRIVGALLMIGQGKITIEEFKQAMEKGRALRLNISVPPQGLFLCEVKYPYLDKVSD